MKFLVLLLSLLYVRLAAEKLSPDDPRYSDCNICGCPDCFYYLNQATVSYDYNNTRRRTNCETLQAWATNKWIFDPSYCPRLVQEAYDVCACSYPNGTMLKDLWDGRVESFPLALPEGYQRYYDKLGNPLKVEQLTAEGLNPDGSVPLYTTSKEAEKILKKTNVPDAKYFDEKPGFYDAYLRARDPDSGSRAASMRVIPILGLALAFVLV